MFNTFWKVLALMGLNIIFMTPLHADSADKIGFQAAQPQFHFPESLDSIDLDQIMKELQTNKDFKIP